MTSTTIGGAISAIGELLPLLENSYWEAADCAEKDSIFNLIQTLTREYIELNKLSVQDHEYPYEVITTTVHTLANLLAEFCEMHCPVMRRHETRDAIQHHLQQLRSALTPAS